MATLLYMGECSKPLTQMTTSINSLNIIGMKDLIISYTHSLGDVVLPCYRWEVGAILRNLLCMAMDGHKFSNVTIFRV